MIEERKYKYRIINSATQIATEKGKAHGCTDQTIINQPCSWCKTPENAEKKFKKGVAQMNRVGNIIFIITEYHIEAVEA